MTLKSEVNLDHSCKCCLAFKLNLTAHTGQWDFMGLGKLFSKGNRSRSNRKERYIPFLRNSQTKKYTSNWSSAYWSSCTCWVDYYHSSSSIWTLPKQVRVCYFSIWSESNKWGGRDIKKLLKDINKLKRGNLLPIRKARRKYLSTVLSVPISELEVYAESLNFVSDQSACSFIHPASAPEDSGQSHRLRLYSSKY